MKTIDRLLLKAKELKESWQVWPCLVDFDTDQGKWRARLATGNKSTREKIISDEYFDDMDAAVQCCHDFIEKYGSGSDETTIFINDILPGGEAHEESAAEIIDTNGG